ncbi:unnamed protein product [Vicia faba]|uniref:Uncharacterized protein n=1 Tax=Vicia faba TaxID=3906 RepID=A0AAV1A832_VICFA|nr:unnamed protein product [Vicia faba]
MKNESEGLGFASGLGDKDGFVTVLLDRVGVFPSVPPTLYRLHSFSHSFNSCRKSYADSFLTCIYGWFSFKLLVADVSLSTSHLTTRLTDDSLAPKHSPVDMPPQPE